MPPPLASSKGEGMSTKPLRLGTRSCIECRAHKVRCVFQKDQTTCDYCIKHTFFCQPQSVRQSAANRRNGQADETAVLKKRLQILENAVLEMSKSEEKSKTLEDLNSVPTSESPSTNHGSERSNGSKSREIDPPLLRLLAESRFLQESLDEKIEEEYQSQSSQRYIEFLLESINTILNEESVRFILRATESFCLTLPAYYFGPTRAQSISPGQIEQNAIMLINAIHSNQPPIMAKAIAWIALCVQQLPLPEDAQKWVLQDSPGVLVQRLIKVAAQLLATDDELGGGSIDGVECMVMLQTLNMDMGKPKRAWFWCRQAVNMTISLGLNNLTSNSDPREVDLWFLISLFESQMSLLLGYPSIISSVQGSSSHEELYKASPVHHILYRIGEISGKTTQRDQAPESEQHSITMRLDQEAIALQDLFPREWWDNELIAGLDLVSSFFIQSAKFQFFLLLNIIHVPFMLRCLKDEKYAYNWRQSMEASRWMVRIYCNFRQDVQTKGHLCQTMDFYGFSAALTMIVGLKTCAALTEPVLNAQDWELIERCRECLRSIATDMYCEVAGQGSNVLDLILKTRQGIRTDNVPRSSIIPYFGRVNINLDFFLDTLNSGLDLQQPQQQRQIENFSYRKEDSMAFSIDPISNRTNNTPEMMNPQSAQATHLFTELDFNNELATTGAWTFTDMDLDFLQNTI